MEPDRSAPPPPVMLRVASPDCRQLCPPGGEAARRLAEARRTAGIARSTRRGLGARGCERRHGRGDRGRVAMHERIVVDDARLAAVGRRAPIDELRAPACAGGMGTRLQDGLDTIDDGLGDLGQLLTACSR